MDCDTTIRVFNTKRNEERTVVVSTNLGGEYLTPLFSEAWTGSKVWAASLFLANWIRKEKDNNTAFRLGLELGSGTGILSVLAVVLGVPVLATDLPNLVDLIQQNARKNLTGEELELFSSFALPWGSESIEELFTQQQCQTIDKIFISDCINNIYGVDSVKKLADTLSTLQKIINEKVKIILTYESRHNDELFNIFTQHMTEYGFSYNLIESLPPQTPVTFPGLVSEPVLVCDFEIQLYIFEF